MKKHRSLDDVFEEIIKSFVSTMEEGMKKLMMFQKGPSFEIPTSTTSATGKYGKYHESFIGKGGKKKNKKKKEKKKEKKRAKREEQAGEQGDEVEEGHRREDEGLQGRHG